MSLSDRLSKLLKTHGKDLLRDRARLLDLAAAWDERERNLLATACRAGVAERLLRGGDEANQRQAYKILTEDFFLDSVAAEKTVGALSLALGHAPAPRLAIQKPARPARFPPLFTARRGRVLARLVLGCGLFVFSGYALGWFLWQIADTQTARDLKAARAQLSQLRHSINEAIANEKQQREALRAEIDALKKPSETKSGPRLGKTVKACPDCPQMVSLPAGEFKMGSDTGDADEKPVHTVAVKAFKLGLYEVTQAQWQAVMGKNPSYFSNCGGDCPVENVTFDDIQAFIAKLNEQTGQHYRLATEAEWEYACRAGKTQTYCGSDDVNTVAWYSGNSDSQTHPVGKKQKNAFGLYDMSGNVWEWLRDCWHDSYNGAPSDGSAWENNCTEVPRVVRGGSWYYKPVWLRSAYRFWNLSVVRYNFLGFRLAQD